MKSEKELVKIEYTDAGVTELAETQVDINMILMCDLYLCC